MRALAALVLAGALSACVTVPAQSLDDRAQRMQEVARVTAQARDRGEITALQRSQLMREAARQLFGEPPHQTEYWAYHAWVSAEVDAKRMTQLEADALNTRRGAEIAERARAAQADTLRAIAPYVTAPQAPARPAFVPTPPPAGQPAPAITLDQAPPRGVRCESRRDLMGRVITDCY